MSETQQPSPLTKENIVNLERAALLLVEKLDEMEQLLKVYPETKTKLHPNPIWPYFYAFEYKTFLVLFLDGLKVLDTIIARSLSDDPNNEVLDYIHSDLESQVKPDDFSTEDIPLLLAFVRATNANLDCYGLYGISLNSLVRMATTDNAALFKAVSIDRTAMSCPLIASRIAQAEVENDEDFMKKLSKVIANPSRNRPKQEYDRLRFIASALAETNSFQSYT